MIRLRNFLALFVVISIPLQTACDSDSSLFSSSTGIDKKRIPLSAVTLSTPDNCDSFKQKVAHSLISRYTDIRRNMPYCGIPVVDVIGGGGGSANTSTDTPNNAAAPAPSAGSSDSNPGSTSGTNNQEVGVNEGDILKVDASNGNIFVAQGQYLLVVNAYPPQSMNILHTIDVQAHIIALYFDPDLNNILVLSRQDQPYPILAGDVISATPPPASGGGVSIAPIRLIDQTTVKIYHYLDDPNTIENEAPQLTQTINVDGYYQDSRRIEGRLHLITRHYDYVIWQLLAQSTDFQNQYKAYRDELQKVVCSDSIPPLENGDVNVDAIAAVPSIAAAKNVLANGITQLIAQQDVNALLPQASLVSDAGVATPVDNYLSCSDVYFPQLDSDLGLQIITSLNTDGNDVEASAIVNNSWQSYVSKDNLYLAENNNHWFWYEPTMQQMSIHKVALSATERARYLATGLIDGNVGSSFQFSEYNYPNIGSVLRVTSTQGGWGIPILAADGGNGVDATGAPIIEPPRSVNHLTMLLDNNSTILQKIGQIRNIAVNETIRSTRFDGKRAFMVTFRQIDPLFTLDLSDPYSPRLAGELKIPGFSSYIHLYDQNHLLTIGRAGTNSGLNGQMQLQLIDISDLQNPMLLYSVMPTLDPTIDPNMVSSYSYSAAEYDHHAFSFFNGDLLAVPVQYNYYSRTTGYYANFSGVMAYRITPESGFELLGKVNHADLAYEMYCLPVGVLQPQYDAYCPQGYYVNWATPRRSVFETSSDGNNVYLYTVSDVGIKAGQLDLSNSLDKKIIDLSKQLFPPQRYTYYYDVVAVADSSTAISGGGSGPVAAPQ